MSELKRSQQELNRITYLQSENTRLKSELEDVEYRFSCLLDYATGGVLSKTNYTKDVMYEYVLKHVIKSSEDYVEDLIECGQLLKADDY